MLRPPLMVEATRHSDTDESTREGPLGGTVGSGSRHRQGEPQRRTPLWRLGASCPGPSCRHWAECRGAAHKVEVADDLQPRRGEELMG